MWSPPTIIIGAYINLCILLFKLPDVFCLKNVTLQIMPSIVQYRNSSTLRCTYDLENDKLYSVKWYRGNIEFYRYAPGDNPVVKSFEISGISVDLGKSNSAQVVLKDIEFNLAGTFSCEVTTDSPNIHTRVDRKSMSVVQLPEHPPEISVGREPLDYGDILRANCSSYPSRPPADLKFILNNITVNQSELLRRQNLRGWSDLQLELKLSVMHFNEGRLILQCVAQISTIYYEVAELELESVRHPIPARVSAPSSKASSARRFCAEIKHTIQLLAYYVSVLLLAVFVGPQTCY